MSGQITPGTEAAQIFQLDNTWRNLNLQDVYANYPWLLQASDGRIFMAGPQTQTRWIDPNTGQFTADAPIPTNYQNLRDYGSAVLYDNNKVLILGGSLDPQNCDPPTAQNPTPQCYPTKTAETLDFRTPSWNNKTSTGASMLMNLARRQCNATVLPDGKVLVTGGSYGAGFSNGNYPALAAEMWDPVSRTFILMASEEKFRGYHSTGLLLPDGRVLSAGTTGDPVQNRDGQVYSPPYLFAADGDWAARPVIASVLNKSGTALTGSGGPTTTVNYGDRIYVNLSGVTTISKVSMISARLRHPFVQSGSAF